MEIELQEIRDFLAACSPFNELTDGGLDTLPAQLTIRYFRRSSVFPPREDGDSSAWLLRSGAVDFRDSNGQLLDRLAEGDLYTGHCEWLTDTRQQAGVVSEDALLYEIPCGLLKQLCQSSEEFNKHLTADLRQRLQHAAAPRDTSLLTLKAGDLIQREPVTVAASASLQQTAQAMTEHGVSSVMVLDGEQLAGIITDSDLRRRCVAENLPVTTLAGDIMTAELTMVDRETPLFQAIMLMTRLQVHHLPVMQGKRLLGMLSSADITRQQSSNPAFISTDIFRAESIEDLAVISTRLPELQLQLASSSATALHIGEAVSSITDAFAERLLVLGEEKYGPPPVPYVWLAGGSEARQEQTCHSDQDNAMIISDDMQPEHTDYFAQLAQFVSDGLNACGYIYCPGDAMASNPEWCQPLQVWRQYFNRWISSPEPKSLMLSSIFFDLRPVYGDFSLFEQLQTEVLAQTQKSSIFIAYTAANALTHRPPLGIFKNLVLIHDEEHDRTLDIKHRGIVPVTDIARTLALAHGLQAVNTTDRLRAAIDAGGVSRAMGANLIDALEYIASLRIAHQARQIRNGEKPDNYLPPDTLSELERRHLKDAFSVIADMQNTFDNRYQLSRFR
jgi:CBS domain-containing protein